MPQPSPRRRSSSASGRAPYAKSQDTRARILAAALDEASEAGFHKVSVAGIAARAGVAIGNLHYHFGSRGELLHELMNGLVVELMARLHAVEADDAADFFERQRAELLVYLEYMREHPAYVRLLPEVKLHAPELYRTAVAEWAQRLEARIRLGIEQGAVRPMSDAEVAAQAHFLLGSRHYLEEMMGVDGVDDAAIVDAYLGLLRHGLGRDGEIAG